MSSPLDFFLRKYTKIHRGIMVYNLFVIHKQNLVAVLVDMFLRVKTILDKKLFSVIIDIVRNIEKEVSFYAQSI